MAPRHEYRVFLFGRFRLEADGQPVRLPTHKDEALLAYLALHPQPQTRERLAGLFWGGATAGHAAGSLRTALNHLRAALGEAAVLADRYTVQLNPGLALWTDVAALADSRETPAQELLEDFSDEWVVPLREQYRAGPG
jgi:DNA-binding SARP family transcriptional activator